MLPTASIGAFRYRPASQLLRDIHATLAGLTLEKTAVGRQLSVLEKRLPKFNHGFKVSLDLNLIIEEAFERAIGVKILPILWGKIAL